MAAAVASEEGDAFAFEKAGDDGFGGIAERRLDTDFFRIGEALHRVKAAAADDSYACLRFFGRTLRLGFQKNASLSCVKVRTGLRLKQPGYFNTQKKRRRTVNVNQSGETRFGEEFVDRGEGVFAAFGDIRGELIQGSFATGGVEDAL